MKTPVWVWDWKQEKYLRLPPGLIQFSDGKWGFDRKLYYKDERTPAFFTKHAYLFKIEPTEIFKSWERVILKRPGPAKFQPNKGKARITKVQR